ncbi:XPG domain containing-domain-containing protein [Whalleya microplaca]|nr:XPG domain containing-domain-containing protein [Whalleya microplaca]
MGIPGFGALIQRYGVFSSLSGQSVVIDGPALVHTIANGCMKYKPSRSGFLCTPSYALLGRLVIGWLDELRRNDVIVRKIYFDGYLPPAKWNTRRQRLLKQSQKMKGFVYSHPLGSPRSPVDAFGSLKAEILLTRAFGWYKDEKTPRPPFLVPAVIEALRSHLNWNSITQVVPGEADIFCAQDVREKGGIVLTSDSDLIIHDLGPKGSVSFFWDVVETDPSMGKSGITACKISSHDISARLGLDSFGGLPRLAFEKQKGINVTFNQALENARDVRKPRLRSFEYRSFMKELDMEEHLPNHHPVLGVLSSLDPRISELVIQTLLLMEDDTVPEDPNAKESRGPETLSMFLPIMVEDRQNRSAWTMCTGIRQTAYGILQGLAHQRSQRIIEYRTLDPSSSNTGRQIDIPSAEDSIQDCAQLAMTIDKLAEKLSSPELRWFAFAICQDIQWSAAEQRVPLSATLINRVMDQIKDTEDYSWDLIHWTAQVEACLYSLRMAKQILDVTDFLDQDLPAPVQQLRQSLASLPPIAEWPRVENMFNLLSRCGRTNVVAAITDMLGIPMIESTQLPTDSPQPQPTKRPGQKQKRLWVRRRLRDTGGSPSINPYAVLSHVSQD